MRGGIFVWTCVVWTWRWKLHGRDYQPLLGGSGNRTAEGLIEAFDQAVLAERLAQKTESARIQDPVADPFVEIGGHEYDRRRVAVGDQTGLQIGPAHARHVQIGNHARRFPNIAGTQVLFGRGKRCSGVTQRFYEAFRGLTDGFIVVDYRY